MRSIAAISSYLNELAVGFIQISAINACNGSFVRGAITLFHLTKRATLWPLTDAVEK